MGSDVPVKELRPLAEWRDELGLDRLRDDLINGDLDAWYFDPLNGQWHGIPRAHWRREEAAETALGWGWTIGEGPIFTPDPHIFRRCKIHAARPASHDRPGPKPGGKSEKRQACAIAESILNSDAADPPPRGYGRVSALARLVKPKLTKQYDEQSIQKMIRSAVREWEKQNPDK
jgi:hypothetical protein